MLGFLSVSTWHSYLFSEEQIERFNPVLGFLSVSTRPRHRLGGGDRLFQSRAGFSECLDAKDLLETGEDYVFQSRAGFSECLDTASITRSSSSTISFNPVLGFLSVSTNQDDRDGHP